MRELKQRIADLEHRLGEEVSNSKVTTIKRPPRRIPSHQLQSSESSDDELDVDIPLRQAAKSSICPPSPSLSPEHLHPHDPDETEPEPEPNLRPPLTLASSSSTHSTSTNSPTHPSIISLLATASSSHRPQLPAARPAPSPQATNPTLYLPFPTPSPTSPFLAYHSTTSHTTSSTGPPEPSPFLAPLQSISLFGGALNLDHQTTSPSQSLGFGLGPIPKDLSPHSEKQRDMPPEEAANLLLAFSSPDTLRPSGSTPKMVPVVVGSGGRERRSALESEDFVLDGGVVREGGAGKEIGSSKGMMVGKTARDILRM